MIIFMECGISCLRKSHHAPFPAYDRWFADGLLVVTTRDLIRRLWLIERALNEDLGISFMFSLVIFKILATSFTVSSEAAEGSLVHLCLSVVCWGQHLDRP